MLECHQGVHDCEQCGWESTVIHFLLCNGSYSLTSLPLQLLPICCRFWHSLHPMPWYDLKVAFSAKCCLASSLEIMGENISTWASIFSCPSASWFNHACSIWWWPGSSCLSPLVIAIINRLFGKNKWKYFWCIPAKYWQQSWHRLINLQTMTNLFFNLCLTLAISIITLPVKSSASWIVLGFGILRLLDWQSGLLIRYI